MPYSPDWQMKLREPDDLDSVVALLDARGIPTNSDLARYIARILSRTSPAPINSSFDDTVSRFDKAFRAFLTLLTLGDQSAWRVFCETYDPILYRIVEPLAKSAFGSRPTGEDRAISLAEDAVNDTFSNFHQRGAAQFNPAHNLQAYLIGIAKNATKDLIKQKGNKQSIQSSEYDFDARYANEFEEELAERAALAPFSREQLEAFEDALQRLDPRDRDCLVLKEQGLTLSEIAAIIGEQPGNVAAIRSRAKDRLYRMIYGVERPKKARSSASKPRHVTSVSSTAKPDVVQESASLEDRLSRESQGLNMEY